MKYSRTAIGLLTAQYRSVLKKCLLINLGLYALGAVAATPANAADITTRYTNDNTTVDTLAGGNYKVPEQAAYGSAITNMGTLTITGETSFENNSSVTDGGAIFNEGAITFNENVSFSENSSKFGGAIENNSGGGSGLAKGVITFEKAATFENNTASIQGGAIVNSASDEMIFKGLATFINNKIESTDTETDHSGMSVFNTGKMTFQKGLVAENNKSSLKGTSGISNNQGTMTIVGGDVNIQNNEAWSGAGITSSGTLLLGAYLDNEAVVKQALNNIVFADNISYQTGAGLYASGTAKLYATNISFTNNIASGKSYGAAAALQGGNLEIIGSNITFSDNKATGSTETVADQFKYGGGALQNRGVASGSTVVIGDENSVNTFSNNQSASYGGALHARAYATGETATTTITGKSTFTGNTATLRGGAIYNHAVDGNAIMKIIGEAVFSGNTDSTGANDIYNTGTLYLTADNGKTISLAGGIDGDANNKGTTNIDGLGTVEIANALKNQNVNNTGNLVLDGAKLDGTTISGNGSVKIAGDSEVKDTTLEDQTMEVASGEELKFTSVTLNKTASGKGTLTNKAGGILNILNSNINVAIDNYGRLISDPTTYTDKVTNNAGAYASFTNDTFTGSSAELANEGTVDLNTATFASGAKITGTGVTNLKSGTSVFEAAGTANSNTINLASGAKWTGMINGGIVNAINGAIDTGITGGSVSNTTDLYVDAKLGDTGTIDAISGGKIKKISLTGDSSYGANNTLTLTAASGSTFDSNVEIDGMNYYTEKTVSGNTLTLSDKLVNESGLYSKIGAWTGGNYIKANADLTHAADGSTYLSVGQALTALDTGLKTALLAPNGTTVAAAVKDAAYDGTYTIAGKIDTKQATITGAATTITSADLTANKVLVSDASGKVAASGVDTTTLGYLDATSSIQTQLNSKVDTSKIQATLASAVSGQVADALAVKNALADKLGNTDIVTSTAGWSATTSDTKVASEKLVKNSLDAKLDTTIANDTTVTVASGKQLTFGGDGNVKFTKKVVLSDASELKGIGAAKVTADDANLAVSNTALRATLTDYSTTADLKNGSKALGIATDNIDFTSAQKTLLGKTVSTAAPTSASDDTTLPTSKAVYSAITGERDATATLTNKTIDAANNTIRNLGVGNFAAANIAKGATETVGSSTKLTTETYVNEKVVNDSTSIATDKALSASATKTLLNDKVDNTRTINSKALSSNIVLDGSNINTSTSYAKAGSAAAIAAGESIDTALGKLEYKADQAVTGIKLNSASSTLSPTSGIVTLGLGTAATENVATAAIADGSTDTSLVTAQQVAAYAGGKIVNNTTATDTNKALSASATKTLLDGKAAKNGSNSEAFDVSTLRTAGAITVRDDTTGTHSAIISAITNGSTGSLLNISTGVKAANLTLGSKAATGISTDIGGAYAAKDPILATEAYADKKVADATIFTNKNKVLISDATSGAIVESAVTGTQLSLLSGMTAVDTDYTTSSAKTTTFATVGTVDGAFLAKTFSGTLADSTADTKLTTASQVATYVSGKVVDNTSATDTNKALSANATKTLLADKFDNSRITKLSSEAANTATVYSTGKTNELLGYKFDKADIVTSTAGWSTTTSDTKVASEKLVKDSLDLKLTGTKEATYNSSASGNTYYTAETVNSSFAKLNGDSTVNFSAATLAATTVNATTVNAGTNGTALTDGTLRLKNATYDTTLSAISDGTSGSLLNISTGAKVNGGLEATGNVKAAGLTLGSKTATSISTDITGATNNNVLATEAYADTKIAKTDIVKSTAGWSATPSDDKVTSEKLVYESLHGTGNATTPAGAVVIGDKAATTTLGTAKAQVALNDSAQTATITAANGIILSGPTTVTSIKFSGDAATDPAIVGVSQTVAGATANKLVTEGAVFAKTGTVTFSGMNYVGSATDLTTAVSNLDTNVYQDIHGTGNATTPAGAVAIGDKAATTTLGTTKAKIALNDSAQTATITAANGISLDGTKFVKSIDTATDTTTPANNDILATKSTVTNAIKGIFSGNNVWTGTNEFQNVLSVTRGGTKVFEVDALGKTTIASLSIGTSTPMNGIDTTPMKGNTTHLVTSAGVYEALHGTTSTGDTLMFGDEADGVIFGSTTGYNMTLDFGGSKTTIGNTNGSVQMAEGALTASASVKAGTGSATSTMTSSSVKVADSGTYGEMTKESITLHNSSGDVFSVTSDGSLTAGSTAASPTAKLDVNVATSTASISTQKGGTSSADLTINGATGKSELTSTKAATTATVSADASTGVASVTAADTTSKKSAGMTASAAAATAELSAANTATGSEASLALNGAAGTATLTADNGTNAMTATLSGKTFTVADNTTGTPSTILEAGVDASSNKYVTVNGDLTATGDFSAAGNTFTVANDGTKTTMTLTGDEVVNGKATFNGSTAGQKVEIENGVVTASNGFTVNNGTSDVFTVNAAGKTTTTTLAFTGDSGTNTVKAIDNGTTAQSIASTGISADQQQTMATVGTVLKSAENATYTNTNATGYSVLTTTDNTINKAINKIDSVVSGIGNVIGDWNDLRKQADGTGTPAKVGSNITYDSSVTDPAKSPTLVSAAIDLDNAIGNRKLYNASHYASPTTAAADTPISVSEAIANMDTKVYEDIHGQGDSTTPLKGTVNIGDKAAVTQVGAQTGGKLTEGLAIDTANGKGVALGSFDTAGDPDTGLVVKKSSAGAYDTVELRAHSGSDEMTATLEKDSFKVKTGSTPTTILEVKADSTNGNHVDITGDENVTGNITVQASSATAKVEIKNDGTVKTTDATGAQTVELKNNLMEAKDASNISTYGAAGIVMNGTQFRVDATNGDMHAANGNFAVTTTSGKTTMSLTGDAVVTGDTKTGTFTMANANYPNSDVTVTGIDRGAKTSEFSDKALATTQSIFKKAQNAEFTGGQSTAGATYATADYATGTKATTIKKAFQNVENFVGAKENMSHNAIKATTTPASVTAAVNTLATNVAAGMGGTFATDGSWSQTIKTTDKSVSYGDIAASSAANGLAGAISQVHSNIGAGDVLDSIAARSSAIANNGVASTKTVNANIAALNDTIGDLTGLKKANGNLTNGIPGTVPTTVVEAFNNIDATLGRIHGLVQDNGNGTYTYNKSSGAVTQDWTNLAVGTTVEEHVLAVDTAIGNRNQYSKYQNIEKGEPIADSLEKINLRLGDVASLNQMNYYREQNPNDVNLSSAVRALDTNLYRLEHDFKTLRHETHAGLASAAALSALVPNPRSAGDTTLSFGTGAYQGHTAAAFGGFHWITNNLMVNAGVGWDNREATARMGVSYSF